jgi:hypothetical protein
VKPIRFIGSVAFAVSAPIAWSQTPPADPPAETDRIWCSYANYMPCYEKGDPIVNPETGVTEFIEDFVFKPYGSVKTTLGQYLWAGPITKDATFTIPGTPAVPELPEILPTATSPGRPHYDARPAVPAITYTIGDPVYGPDPAPSDDNIDPPLIGFHCTPACGIPGETDYLAFTLAVPTDTKPDGLGGLPGRDARVVDSPAPSGGVNRYIAEREGRWGDSGDSGWGVEVCIFGCWTIGESAEQGDPGENGPALTRDVTLADTHGIPIVSLADNAPGIIATSRGGRGGSGGNAWGALPAANGGPAGIGGRVEVTNHVDVTTTGAESHGMFIQSRAGIGGTGGSGYILGDAGSGGPAAQGGDAIGINRAHISTTGNGAIGLFAQSLGGGGGDGGDSYGLVGDAGSGSEGGHSGNSTATNYGTVSTGSIAAGTGEAAHGVFAQSVGGKGGNAGDAGTLAVALGGDGSAGGDGHLATANNEANAEITTRGNYAVGLYAQSIGGGGGDGGSGVAITGIGGYGGGGGSGGTATANNRAGARVTTLGIAAYGVLAQSVGGGGGNGGDGNGIGGIGGKASGGGSGGVATINNAGSVVTGGQYAHGLLAQSIGGGGGSGGNGNGLVGVGGGVAATGFNTGGTVTVTNAAGAEVITGGDNANAIMAQSIGGGGGTGAGSSGLVAVGGEGGMGGDGRDVHVTNRGTVRTIGIDSKGILGQSIGGGGGSASASHGAVNLGGSGAGGGNGDLVDIKNYGDITTREEGGDGIFAQSIGGGGGNGASAAEGSGLDVVGIGGSGAGGGNGGAVQVTNEGVISTNGARARGIMAESIGGGGGSGGDGGALIAIGGSGGSGGSSGVPATPDIGGNLTIINGGVITTRGNQSSGIEARSVGGGGGSGGSAYGGPLAIGGSGGAGGAGGIVDVTHSHSIATLGNDSNGIFAQSIGGGGGNGGNSVSVSAFGGASIGGAGGIASDGNSVIIRGTGIGGVTPTIDTIGDRAKGIFAQSVGGGGGNGGFAVQASGGYIGAMSAAVGGIGGRGGRGQLVDIDATTDITTHGFDADGILAQSVGGGGGNGGFAMSYAFSGGDIGAGSIAAGIGGRGGDGGAGGQVDIDAGGSIDTTGEQSEGLIAQSIGGGGGSGGYAITIAGSVAAGGAGAVSAAIGGDGGLGGVGGQVDVDYTGDIHTGGEQSTGVVAQTIGGGGGNGGYTIAGAVAGGGAGAAAASVGVGGSGGGGGIGGVVHSTINGNLTTERDRSTGMVVQSVGGRGGNGGFNVSGTISGAGAAAAAVSVGIGGSGGGGGNGGTATGTLNGDAVTRGRDSDAVVVQSVGGGGGNGGFNVSGAITGGGGAAGAVSVGIGGAGGGAGSGVLATGIVNGNLTTVGDGSNGLVAQSVGGGGGNGGFNISAVIAGAGATAGGASVGLGGAGGGGGGGGAVIAMLTGSAHTQGNNATAVVAQSVGGGGGNGGFNVSGSITGSGANAGGVAVGLGGSGGGGGASGQTTLTVIGDTLTEGHDSGGVLAQSIAGGGGNGGFNVSSAISASGTASGAVAVGLGGSGGDGGFTSGTSTANVTGNIVTLGNNSTGLISQSIGGGGGNGGFNVTGTVSASGGTSGSISVGLGGSGGRGGSASTATGILRGDLQTFGKESDGVLVQSIGGGGGNGGFNVTGSIAGSGSNAGAVSVGLGGSGGSASNGGAAIATVTGNVMTAGNGANSIIAQSIGGGGGNGGFNVSGSVSGAGGNAVGVAVGLGGSGGGGGNGGTATATVTGNASTQGNDATAVIVQSLGGGGGTGGMNVSANVSGSGSSAGGVTVGLGGAGGGGGDSALTTLTLTGDVVTQGDDAGGILVQSVGGGGGAGGMNVSANVTGSGSSSGAVSVGLGGSGGLGGDGAVVSSTVTGDVTTRGDRATGYIAQSLGGGGGNGGMNVSGTLVASGSGAGSVSVGLGGSGGGGGDGRAVTASLTGNLTTLGDDAYGVLFQSVGGGGGNGGMNISTAVSAGNNGAGALAIGVGGSGGGGGDSAAVTGTVAGDTATAGDRSFGVLMQSIGGGGGNGGMNVSGAVSLSKGPGGSLGVGVGGFGGDGGDASTVTGTVSGAVLTTGASSTGVLAQSVGGGGGNGGMNISGALSIAKESTAAAAIGVGGFGGGPGNGELVTLTRTGATTTYGTNSDGVVAQSIGGGGGNGGMNISGALSGSTSGTAFSAALGLGGFGGGGGDGRNVIATVTGDVSATGSDAAHYFVEDGVLRRELANGSNGVLAQSVGGSGGNGGINISGGIALASQSQGHSYGLTLGVGGFGGAGGDAGTVRLDVTADNVASVGDRRFGVGAQSIGGGGGNGGMNVSGGIVMDGQMVGGVGGFGGAGGEGRDVRTSAVSDISATGAGAIGFLAQSVGGGGGNGGMNVSGGIQASRDAQTPSLVFGVGGFGGAGNISGDVLATQRGNITVQGGNAIGVLVQSVAGGGGNGALNVSGNAGQTKGYNAALGLGGHAGTGADAGIVSLESDGDIVVSGIDVADSGVVDGFDPSAFDIAQMSFRERANGILAQSIGGGGGNGGMNVSGVGAINGNPITVGIGGSGGTGGNAGAVSVTRGLNETAVLATLGHNANGLTAQSIGGGGGNAGMNFLFSNSGASTASRPVTAVMLGVGGDGAAAGDGNEVDVEHAGTILTEGDHSYGLLAQSVGGGGGSATFNIGLGNNKDAKAFNVALGGGAGDAGDGKRVDVDHSGNISTLGDVSTAIFAQSVGGGGGSTGMDMVTSPRSARGIDISLGRAGGSGGTGGDVFVQSDGVLTTVGDRSLGIRAQSVGNGGGDSSSSSIEFSGEGEEEGQDWSTSMEIGIEGGLGGEAGNVEVHAGGAITTHGLAAHGIHAQSVGGGGGAGGSLERHGIMEAANQVSVGVGGSGGQGGISGVVSVDNAAVIRTSGDDSHGVFAQSIAGGGGMGGYIAQLDTSIGGGAGGSNFSLQMGGTGGTGAAAEEVNVFNSGTILTSGRRSYGIDAQSVGGGGGEGGAIMSAGITRGSNSRNVSMNLGGFGGEGGTGEAVSVTNEGRIDTTGDDSVGIRAQSVGGKGGDAGIMLELGIIALSDNQKANNVSIKVGGNGGRGASSGDVEVFNTATDGIDDSGVITTSGRAAHGIFAQSLGGGGGNGSSIITANLGASSQGQATLVNMNVGGTGGQGGTAGDVHVDNASVIETDGDEAHGVFAQSIGGGGGNGGLVISANAVLAQGDAASEALLALGGSGGDGDDAGDVTVDNSGQIVTRGARSHGILAQSIGGGGGNAGIAFGASTNPATTVIAGVLSTTFGGTGGHGGEGGHVTVNHSGDITVLGENSQAVVAESINGGGGHVALDFRGVTSLPGVPSQVYNGIPLPNGTDSAPVFVFAGGGDHQQNSDAGRVTLNYSGTFGVAGNNGAANAVQAIGGGGGTFDLDLDLNDAAGTADDVAIEGRLGGVSGTNNRGGDIESEHNGDLVTEGNNTPGALVQSIGGGGGRANLDLTSSFDSLTVNLTLGGENGSNEEGGDIEHTQSGSVSTQGTSAHGGVFQSIGGGGGALSLIDDGGDSPAEAKAARRAKLATHAQGASVNALTPTLSFGSSGGSVLSGGDVSLKLDGNVQTTGDNSIGMIFQSVGAGGGIANVLGVDSLSVTLGGSNGASGDGGNLEVKNTGDVQTAGLRSHGVFLQSIGGGGSAVFTDAAQTSVSLSAANTGNGGDIAFEQHGTIATFGDHAYSLFAQSVGGGGGYVDGGFAASAGGTGSAGAIDLALNGDVAALGEFSTALFAQSAGANGLGGNITASLSAGNDLVGGLDGVAVYFDGGAANKFTNFGTVSTLSGPLGFAFRGGAGGDFIDNHGAVMGNVDLGAGANGFANNIDGTFYSGTTVNLGDATNVLRNDGIIAPGAQLLAVRTHLTGSFVQSATGTSNMEIDFALREGDHIAATGTAEVAGAVNFSLFNVDRILPGVSFQPLFVADHGVINRGIAFNPQESIVIDYQLAYNSPNVLGVQYEVDFAAGGLVGNRVQVGKYLNRVQSYGGPGGLGDTITAAVLETSLDDYAFMLTQLGTEFYAEQQALALSGAQRFARNLQSCGTTTIGEASGDDASCYWIRYDDNPSTRDSRAGFPAAKDDGYGISQGVQIPQDGDWSLGVAMDFEHHRSSGFDGLWSAESKFFQLGASARRSLWSGTVGATLSLGNDAQSVNRLLGVTDPVETQGDRDVLFLTNVLDYTYDWTSGGFSLQPSLSLGTSWMRYGHMTEDRADSQNAVIVPGKETHLWVEPAIGGRYVANFGSGASLRTFARIGLLQYLSGTSTKVRAGLEGAPLAAEPMRISSDLDRTHVVGEAGLQFETAGGFTLGLSYMQQESEIRDGGAGSFRFVFPLH